MPASIWAMMIGSAEGTSAPEAKTRAAIETTGPHSDRLWSPGPVVGENPGKATDGAGQRLSRFQRLRLYSRHLPRLSWPLAVLLLAALVEAAVLVFIQAGNYLAFKSSQGDLGNYNQAFFTTVHGQGFFYYTTNIPAGSGGSLFAVHFSPFLALLLPFYALAPSPLTLIALKQLALAFGVVPIFGIARTYFRRLTLPFVFSALYLLSPLTIAVDWNSFDPEAFIPLALLAALYFLVRGRFWGFLVSWIVTLSIIESIPALLALFAIGGLIGSLFLAPISPWVTRRSERQLFLVALIVAIGWLGLSFFVLRAVSPIQGAFGDVYEARYTVLGANSFLDVIPRAIADPGRAGAAFQYQGSQKFLFVVILILAGGAAFLLGGLRYLLPLAGYLVLALPSNSVPLYIFGAQYPAYVSGFLFVGTIEGAVLIVDSLARAGGESRRVDLIRDLKAEATTMAQRVRTSDDNTTWRLEVTRMLRAGLGDIAKGDLPGANREIRRAARILDAIDPNGGTVGGASTVAVVGADGPRGSSNDRRAWRRHWAADKSGWSELGIGLLPAVCVLISIGFASPLLSDPAAGGYEIAYGTVVPTTADSYLHSVIGLVPARGSVFTTGHIFPEVSGRPNAFVLPNGGFIEGQTSFAATLNRFLNESNYVLTDLGVDPQGAVITRDLGQLNNSPFGVYAAEDGALLYLRNWTGLPVDFVPWTYSIAGGNLTPTLGNRVSRSTGSAFASSLYHPAGGNRFGKLWSGPSDLNIPPGEYKVSFFFDIQSPTNGSQVEFKVIDYPVKLTDNISATSYLGSHHTITFAPSSPFDTLANATLVGSYPTWTTASLSLNLTWTGNGYLSFPGYELSTRMSMYLLGATMDQIAPLP
jgi:uncharacterized membrane protein